MRTIMDGDISKAQAWVKFTCYECGCVFEAERGEYSQRRENKRDGFDRWFFADCPCCKRLVLKQEVFRRKKDKAKELVYPTWAEWLKEQGLAKRYVLITEYGPNTINQANKDVDILVVNAYKPIPADIAEKLGIKPKEG